MSLGQLFLLHLMAGAGVAVAVYLAMPSPSQGVRWFQVVTAILLWPLYLPILLVRTKNQEKCAASTTAAPADDLAQAIAQVDAELEGALRSLDGWAEGVLARERQRLYELRHAWTLQAQRIREMDRLLNRPEYAEQTPLTSVGASERL